MVRPKSAIWVVPEKGEISTAEFDASQKAFGDKIDEGTLQFVETKKRITFSDPPHLVVDEHNVGGPDGQIDRITTPDGGEWFWNFDQEFNTGNRDHPVCMFFYNNAEVDKVKNDIFWGITYLHSRMLLWHYDPTYEDDQTIDTDIGSRESELPVEARHIRVYAPYPEDHFFDVDFGYFIVGTVHWDYSSNTEEDTEESLCQRARDKGYTVYEDYCYIGEAPGATNDGCVSYVNVP